MKSEVHLALPGSCHCLPILHCLRKSLPTAVLTIRTHWKVSSNCGINRENILIRKQKMALSKVSSILRLMILPIAENMLEIAGQRAHSIWRLTCKLGTETRAEWAYLAQNGFAAFKRKKTDGAHGSRIFAHTINCDQSKWSWTKPVEAFIVFQPFTCIISLLRSLSLQLAAWGIFMCVLVTFFFYFIFFLFIFLFFFKFIYLFLICVFLIVCFSYSPRGIIYRNKHKWTIGAQKTSWRRWGEEAQSVTERSGATCGSRSPEERQSKGELS